MNRSRKTLLYTVITVLVVLIAVLIGKSVLFDGADILVLQDESKFVGAKPTWLTGYSAADDAYYKLADVSAPSGFALITNANDADGNILTTQFDYARRAVDDGEFTICVYAEYSYTAAAALENGFTSFVIPTDKAYNGLIKQLSEGKWLVLVQTPYENAFIAVSVSAPADYDMGKVISELSAPFAKISPVQTADEGQLTLMTKKIKGLKSGWLTGYSKTDDNYYKLADVSAPSGFNAVETADSDGDYLTTQFDYARKENKQVVFGVHIYAEYAYASRDAAVAAGFEPVVLSYTGEVKGNKTYEDIDVLLKHLGDGSWQCLIASPYEDAFIAVDITCPADYTLENVSAEMYAVASKITPQKQLHSFVADFKLNFIDDDRYMYLVKGLGTTLMITLLSGLMGTVLGAIVASIRSTYSKNKDNMHRGLGKAVLAAADKVCEVYLTVIRGTPVMVQLLIMYLIIFASSSDGTFAAIIAFGINSGAYVAEIIRGGIMSIDNGQFEAGRSLGFNYLQTMWYIILPQVFKSILPTLANEFIALLKETSVCGYVAVKDLNKGGEIIRSVTYSPFLPLLAVAAIYLVLVLFFTRLVGILERRLRRSEH